MVVLKVREFMSFNELVQFANANITAQANIVEIVHDATSGKWAIFYT